MPDSTPTWRRVDGDIVPGLQRPVLLAGRGFQLAALACFADDLITWGYGRSTDLAGLRAALADGSVVVQVPAGSEVHVPGLGTVTTTEPNTWLTEEMFLGEVADDLDRLHDRPDSSRRAHDAFLAYAADPSGRALEAARAAYLEVPSHRRIFMFGDMDHQDVAARILLAELGEEIPARHPDHTLVVTDDAKSWAVGYFRRHKPAVARWQADRTVDGPQTASALPLTVGSRVFADGWPDDPGTEALQIDFPAAVVHEGREFPSVAHAYWALSTADPQWRDRIAAADRGHDARDLAASAPRREDWAAARIAVMGVLLRDRCRRHPALAATLLATGDARILYVGMESGYWSTAARQGTNWIGRLLETIRSELAAEATGILPG